MAGKQTTPAKAPADRKGKAPAVELQKKARRGAQIPETVTLAQLAEHLGLSVRWVKELVDSGVLSKPGGGGNARAFQFGQAVREYIASIKASAERAKDSSSSDKLRDRREQEIALRMAVKERELIPLAEAIADTETMAGAMLEEFSSLPARITGNPRERQRIELIFDEARLRLSDRFAKSAKALRTGKHPAEAGDEDDA